MKIYEIGTGYTSIPAKMGAATEIVVEELMKSLKKMNLDVCLIDIKDENRKETGFSIVEVKVPKCLFKTDVQLGILHKVKRVVYSISLAKVVKDILKDADERKILHFHNQYNMFFFLKLVPEKYRKNCVTVYTNHSYIWHDCWESIESVVKKRYFQEIYSMNHADCIFLLNKNSAETITKNIGVSKEKIKIIDNGVNTNIYRPLNEHEKTNFKKSLQLENKKIFIQVGSVCDRKNQLGAIQLLQPLMKKDKNIVFVYAGGIISQEYQQEIEQYIIENNLSDQIRYLGEINPGEALNNYYNIAEAMIFPSKSEGFSLVILEAMSAGIPVVINKDLHFELADCCLRYSTDKDFLSLLQEQIMNTNNQKKLSEYARKTIEKKYSWDIITSNYMQTINKVLGDKKYME